MCVFIVITKVCVCTYMTAVADTHPFSSCLHSLTPLMYVTHCLYFPPQFSGDGEIEESILGKVEEVWSQISLKRVDVDVTVSLSAAHDVSHQSCSMSSSKCLVI